MINIHPNPLGISPIGDPFILRASDGKYYLYGTSFTNGFFVHVSEDLWSWSEPTECYTPGESSFGMINFWAPEVIEQNGKYYMYYSANWKKNEVLHFGVSVADSPVEPFIDAYDRKRITRESMTYCGIDYLRRSKR